MHKRSILVLLLLNWITWLPAAQSVGEDSGKASGPVTLDGCLQSDNGHYMLVEKDGTPHQLTGAANKLKRLVDHQIEVIGEPTTETIDTSQAGIASSAAERRVFRVKTVTEKAKSCTAP